MFAAIRDKYPDNNLEVLEYFVSKYVSTELQQFISYLASLEVEQPTLDETNTMTVSRYQLAHNIAKSMCCLYEDDHYNCIVTYNKLVDAPKPEGLDASEYYKKQLLDNVPDPDEVFWLSLEKLKVLFGYFEIAMDIGLDSLKEESIIVSRLKGSHDITDVCKPLCEVEFINTYMKAEDPIKVDFANKRIGGGVLKHGCCQEELMFLSNPDLIGLMPLVPILAEDEAVVVSGVKQMFVISGYGYTAQLSGQYNLDVAQTIIMVDAIDYRNNNKEQYEMSNKMIELNKLIVAYSGIKNGSCISTGNWGCGIYAGDPRIKFMLQWLAASSNGHNLKFYAKSNYYWSSQVYSRFKALDTKKLLEYVIQTKNRFGV